MTSKRLLTVSALLCVAAALSAWLLHRAPQAVRTTAETAAELDATGRDVAASRDIDKGRAPSGTDARESMLFTDARTATGGDASDHAAAHSLHRVRARLVDAERRPLAGAVLAIELGDARAQAESDASGEVECALDAEVGASKLTFVASAPAHASLHRTRPRGADASTELGELALDDGGALGGRVLDEFRRPLANARVVVEGPVQDVGELSRGPIRERLRWTQGEDDAFELTTDPDGRFRIDGLRATHWSVWARAPGYGWQALPSLALHAGEEHVELELVLAPLDPTRLLRGRVRSPDGAPVGGATVQVLVDADERARHDEVRTDELGFFEAELADRVPCRVRIAPPSWEWDPIAVDGVRAGPDEHEFRFRESAWLWARVHDAAGLPVTAGRLRVLDAGTGNELTRAMSDIDAKGRARLRRPVADFSLRLDAAGFAPTVRGPYALAEVREPLDFVAEPARGVRGRVLAAGRPIEGARVTICRTFANQRLAAASAWTGHGPPFVADVARDVARSVLTGADGRFALELPTPSSNASSLLLVADHDGHGAAYFGPEPASAFERELEIALGEPSVLTGTVVLGSRARVAGWRIHASDAHGTERSTAVADDGTYRLADLFAGAWEVRAAPPGATLHGTGWSPNEGQRRAPDVELAAGSSARLDLVVDDAPIELVGELVVRGADAGAWELFLVAPGAGFRRMLIGTNGRFRVRVEPHTEYRLTLVGLDANWSGAELRERVVTDARGATWRFELEVATLRGRARTTTPGRSLIAELVPREGTEFTRRFALAEDGSYGPLAIPAGRVGVREWALVANSAARPVDPERLAEASVAPGDTLGLELP
ncbi:MAG: carboxypeptidase regulatory-like domain-containing protein [Planctomycetes bacterium]|nr:carboxypeptidase regulatory-like domain-containing protein [Planctomycetota bacterium]